MTFKDLRARYPALIRAGFRFECGEGWIGLLDKYFTDVETILPAGAEYRLDTVQSRYGSLTIDASLSRVESGEVVVAIEKAWMRADGRSVRCCETCGQPGKPRHGEWTSPACDRHADGVEEEPPETAVYTFEGVRYIYDVDQDDVIVLTSERAASIPWLEDA